MTPGRACESASAHLETERNDGGDASNNQPLPERARAIAFIAPISRWLHGTGQLSRRETEDVSRRASASSQAPCDRPTSSSKA